MNLWGHLLVWTVICCMISGSVAENTLPSLFVVGEEYYPFSYTEQGKIIGSSVDLIEAASYAAGIPVKRNDIRLLPWELAYNSALYGTNTLILAMLRTPTRENLFYWIGPINTDASVVFVKPDSPLMIRSLKDLEGRKIGVVTGDARYEMLKSNGITDNQIITSTHADDLIRLVLNDGIDAFYYGEKAGRAYTKKVTGTPDALKVAYMTDNKDVWFAIGKNSSDELVVALQNAIQMVPK